MAKESKGYGTYDPYDTKNYKVIDGTFYKKDTPDTVVNILERSRISRKRLCVYYGDKDTGRAWGDKE